MPRRAAPPAVDRPVPGHRAAAARGLPRRRTAPAAANMGSEDALLPDQLSRNDVFSVIKRNAGAIRKCRDVQPDMAGRVKVKFVVGRSGRVQSTKIMSPKYQGTPIGGCVERKIRAFRFNRFKGAPMPITVPFGI